MSRSPSFSSHSITLAPACQKPFKVYEFWSCDGGSTGAKDVCVSGSRSVELCSLLFCSVLVWSYPIILRAVPQRWRWCGSVLPSLWLWRLIRLIVCNSSLLGVRCLLFLFQRVMINDCVHSSGHCLHSQTFGTEQWEPLLFHVQFAWAAQLGCCFALLTPSCRTGRSADSLVLVWFWMCFQLELLQVFPIISQSVKYSSALCKNEHCCLWWLPCVDLSWALALDPMFKYVFILNFNSSFFNHWQSYHFVSYIMVPQKCRILLISVTGSLGTYPPYKSSADPQIRIQHPHHRSSCSCMRVFSLSRSSCGQATLVCTSTGYYKVNNNVIVIKQLVVSIKGSDSTVRRLIEWQLFKKKAFKEFVLRPAIKCCVA